MRILYTCAGLDLVGAATPARSHFEAILQHLRGLGHTVLVSSPRYSRHRRTDGFASYRLPSLRFRWYLLAEMLRVLIFPFHLIWARPDVIYVRKDTLDVAPALWGRLTRRPVVYEVNGYLADMSRLHGTGPGWVRLFQRIAKYAYSRSAACICVTEDLATEVRGLGAGRVAVVPNGVDPDLVRPHDRQHARQHWGMAADERVLGFVGTLKPWHGLSTAVDALPDASWSLHVFGDGPEGTSLQAAAEAAGVADRVVLHGPIAHEQVGLAYSACDAAYVSIENMPQGFSPLKLWEAMAAATPVVACDGAGIGDVVRSASCGITFTAGDAASLRAALDALADADAKALGARGREHVLAGRTWRHVAKATQAILQEAAGC